MGSLSAKPVIETPAIETKASMLEPHAVWLDRLLARLAADPVQTHTNADPGDTARLGLIPFSEIVAAIDRAKPGLTVQAQVAIYRKWIEANAAGAPLLHAAWFNLGVLFATAEDRTNAAIAYGNSLALRPDMHAAAINLGLLFEAAGQPDQALAAWERALQPDGVRIALKIQQGRLLEKLGRLTDAEKILHDVLRLDPSEPDVRHHWIHIRQKTCQWPVLTNSIPGVSADELLQGSGPLGILALTDDIDLQSKAGAVWVQRKTEPAIQRLAPPAPYPHARVRIGYMSSDFCSHAMSYLISELFERHDRTRFEVFGYCSSLDDGTQIRQRVLAAFDHVRFIRGMPDEQAARLIRDDEIDILIDLNGITDGSRLSVLRWKPAPIQATYLGFIGPVPLPELDYLLCDDFVIPPEHKTRYRPTPLPIGRIFQANDTKRTLGRPLSRAEVGLPDDKFVFCCFSRHYKITEELFAGWMSILRQAGNSVLWLAADNPYSQANLLRAATAAGVDPARLIFAERCDPDLYLSRLGLADLFLDTFPYNAGTVASDATRMQLPLLTLCGESFASRMAGSLLNALGASEGITTTLPRYVSAAVRLAKDPVEYARYKAMFSQRHWAETIGNIDQFTRDFEQTWLRVIHSPSA